MRGELGPGAVRRLPALVCGVLAVAMAMSGVAQASTARGLPVASMSRTVTLAETAHLETSRQNVPGAEISESGRAVGTYDAPVLAGLTIHAHSVTSIVTIYLKGGSITATADASFKFTGEVGNFHGTLQVTHATGTYRHAAGHLTFTGAINRNTLKMWAVTSGTAQY